MGLKKAIVAGIINTSTGDISDTITNPSGKTRLYLKARDELNAEHGKNAFMVFEFSSVLGGNISYIKRNMQSDDPELLNKVYLLKARYDVQKKAVDLERVKSELALIKETMNECLALYNEDHSAKRAIVEDAYSHDLNELQDEVNSLSSRLRQQRLKMEKLENASKEIIV